MSFHCNLFVLLKLLQIKPIPRLCVNIPGNKALSDSEVKMFKSILKVSVFNTATNVMGVLIQHMIELHCQYRLVESNKEVLGLFL